MRKFALALAAFLILGLSVGVQSQSHPCDTAPPGEQTVTLASAQASIVVGVCQAERDTPNNNPTVITNITVLVDGVGRPTSNFTKVNAANAAGLAYFEVTVAAPTAGFTAGQHTVLARSVNATGVSEPLSIPFAVVLAPGVPVAPSSGRVRAS